MPIHIATATLEDHGAVWDILAPTIAAGETYPLPRDLDRANALAYWFSPSHEAFVARDDGEIAGTYYLRSNCLAGGAHVANCGYVTGAWATGRGIGRAMCEHSIARAHARGFLAMQFNLVVSTNHRAVRLWQRCGFEIVGRLPGAFHHPRMGYVDALVMYRTLGFGP
ncbi:acetyltransferase [Nitrospira sp.]|nr:acetyltransferase [Nitrospira sp.]